MQTLHLTLVSYSEAMSPAIPSQSADKRILAPHWVSALLGPGARVGGSPPYTSMGLGKASRWQLGTQMIVSNVSTGRVTADAQRDLVRRTLVSTPVGVEGARPGLIVLDLTQLSSWSRSTRSHGT